MKRFLTLLAVAAVAGAMYVATAPGGRQARPAAAKELAALKRRVTTLSRSLNTLKKKLGQVNVTLASDDGFIKSCLVTAGGVPASQFGDATGGTYGFLYQSAPTVTPAPRTALDIDPSASPQGYLQAVDPGCISTTPPASAHSGSSRLPARAERIP